MGREKWQSYWRYRNNNAEHYQDSKYRLPHLYERTATSRPALSMKLTIRSVKILLLLSVLILIAWFLFFSDYFTIKHIDIIGSITPSVQQEINKLYGRNLLTYSSRGIKETLKSSQSSIKELNIYKGLPDTMRIELALRRGEVIWQVTDATYLLDVDGVAFLVNEEEFDKIKDSLLKIIDPFNQPVELGKKVVSKSFIDFAQDVGQSFSQKSLLEIRQIMVGQTSLDLEVTTDKDWRILFDTGRELEPQLKALVKIIEKYHDQIKEYIDLRIEGKGYFK